MFIFFGKAEIPVTELTGVFIPTTGQIGQDYCAPFDDSRCTRADLVSQIVVHPLVYIISIFSFIGSIIFAIMGGIGLISLPVDFIEIFKNRPRPMTHGEYEEKKGVIGQHAAVLHETGELIMSELRGKRAGGHNRAARNLRRRENDFRRDVLILEVHFIRLEDGYRRQGGDYLKQVGCLVAGIMSYVIDNVLIPARVDHTPCI